MRHLRTEDAESMVALCGEEVPISTVWTGWWHAYRLGDPLCPVCMRVRAVAERLRGWGPRAEELEHVNCRSVCVPVEEKKK